MSERGHTLTMSAWKPGDVAMVDGRLAMVRNRREANGELEVVYFDGGFDMLDDRLEFATVRPLLTIDPEDAEQVERLVKACENSDFSPWNTCGAQQMREALREFATPKPPKPEEPLGLGAVVVDAKGARWVRLSDNFWRSGIGVAAITSNEWERIDAVEVLSEGIR